MLLSLNWLKKYVNLASSVTPEEIGAKLNASTVEVEKIKKIGESLDNIVVGKILKISLHPNADKLKLCLVDIGGEKTQIVCGGSNVEENMLVAVAKVGAKVRWHGEGELVELKPIVIRGEKSAGMICASTEIGLGEMFPLKSEKEILNLNGWKIKPGQALSRALDLDDYILEIDNKSLSHRPDLWGHYGMAREMAVLFDKQVKEYKTEKNLKGGSFLGVKNKIKLSVNVENTKFCSRYMALAIEGVKVTESPQWLKQSLATIGLKSINNIVDITNYVMLDLGQPLHAFDAMSVSVADNNTTDKNIFVRLAVSGEKIKCLDGNEYELNKNDLVIADEKKALALAGVMGGIDSSIKESTGAVILESANFNASMIRSTSTRLGLRTDSAVRFEKSLDPNLCELALQKAVELIMKLCPEAKIFAKYVDKKDFVLPTGPIEIQTSDWQNKLGIKIDTKKAVNILEKLGFKIKIKNKDVLSVIIPTWRASKDISVPEDILEEIARIYGFNNIPTIAPSFTTVIPPINYLQKISREVLEIMVRELGYTETQNYSFVSLEQIKNLGDDEEKYIELDNPLSKEKPFLRRQLILNLLDNALKGLEYYPELKLVEMGNVYLKEDPGPRTKGNSGDLLPKQDTWMTGVFINKKKEIPFWEVKKTLEALSEKLNLSFNLINNEDSQTITSGVELSLKKWMHPGRSANIEVNGKIVGSLYELHPQTKKAFGLETDIGVLELNMNILLEAKNDNKILYKPVPIYPQMERDLAFTLSADITHKKVLEALQSIGEILERVELFDVFTGEKLGVGVKSMAYRLTFYHPERTLTTAEVDKAMYKAIKTLEENFSAKIRQ